MGSGFTERALDARADPARRLVRDTPPIDDADSAQVKGATFVEPELVCEVNYLEITKSTNKMRAPSFKGLRPDKTPRGVRAGASPGVTASERLVARADQQRARVALVEAAVEQLAVEADRGERAAAAGAEREVVAEGRLAPRAAW